MVFGYKSINVRPEIYAKVRKAQRRLRYEHNDRDVTLAMTVDYAVTELLGRNAKKK